VEKLQKMAGAVRTGGKGSMRRYGIYICSCLVVSLTIVLCTGAS